MVSSNTILQETYCMVIDKICYQNHQNFLCYSLLLGICTMAANRWS